MKAEPRDRVSADGLARVQDELRRRGMLDPDGDSLIHEWPDGTEPSSRPHKPAQVPLPLDRQPGEDG
jgi:hypothetical protein